MRAYALPLQILLAIALVLNGIGGAMAGVLVGMPMPGMASAKVGATVELSAESGDCADHADANAAAAEAVAHAPAAASDCHSGNGSDCSDSPECRQACMHASLAVAPAVPCAVIGPRADANLHRLAAGHPAPPLPSPIRPPIA